VLGVIELKDIVKGGIKERFAELRRMGIKTVMITGDNRLTAAAIAAEAGVDDYLAEATPEDKLALIRKYQAEGRLVAMTADGIQAACRADPRLWSRAHPSPVAARCVGTGLWRPPAISACVHGHPAP
jgi:high-affinity K+ transport system ATPase subunit B